ncbi:MAG: hypothetical protein V3W24_06115 [Gemmatimonadota bacterium]
MDPLRLFGTEQLTDFLRQPIHVELWPRTVILIGMRVLEVIGSRGSGLRPFGVRSENEEDARARTGEFQHPVVGLDHGFLGIPVLDRSLVRDQLEHPVDMLFLRPVARNPDHVRPQVRIVVLFQQFLLNFGGPPKTPASGRGHQHEDANFPDIGVKRAPQRLGAFVKSEVVDQTCRLGSKEGSSLAQPVVRCTNREPKDQGTDDSAE